MKNQDQPFILIGGCPRSGTTALVHFLNTNPSFFISSEENLLDMYKVLAKQLSTRQKRQATYEKQGLREHSQREAMSVEDTLLYNFSKTSVWEVLHSVYAVHHQALNLQQPLKVVGDKYPNYFLEIDRILSLKRFKYIHVTRNPVDVINSMVRRTEMAKQGKDWWKSVTEIEEMIKVWSEAYAVSQKTQENPKVLNLHYESLVFDFQNTVQQLNAFMSGTYSFDNVLISDVDKHFDRRYLSDDHLKLIMSNPSVQDYMQKFRDHPIINLAMQC